MKNKDLIAVLESLSPNAEIVVEVSDIRSGNHQCLRKERVVRHYFLSNLK